MELASSARRQFVYPADRAETYRFFGDMGHIVPYLKYIDIEARDPEDEAPGARYRLAYRTQEMGMYDVCVFCDVVYEHEETQHLLRVRPLTAAASPFAPVDKKVGSESAVTTGRFHLTSKLSDTAEGHTAIDMQVEITSDLPLPAPMRFLPLGPIKQKLQTMAAKRLGHVLDHFVQETVAARRK